MSDWINSMIKGWVISNGIPWAIDRLNERTTWAGLAVWFSTAVHLVFTANEGNAFVNFGLACGGLIAVIYREGVKK